MDQRLLLGSVLAAAAAASALLLGSPSGEPGREKGARAPAAPPATGLRSVPPRRTWHETHEPAARPERARPETPGPVPPRAGAPAPGDLLSKLGRTSDRARLFDLERALEQAGARRDAALRRDLAALALDDAAAPGARAIALDLLGRGAPLDDADVARVAALALAPVLDPEVRDAAVESLRSLAAESAAANARLLDLAELAAEKLRARCLAAYRADDADETAVARLATLLGSSDAALRGPAACALGDVPAAVRGPAVAALESAFARESDPLVAEALVDATVRAGRDLTPLALDRMAARGFTAVAPRIDRYRRAIASGETDPARLAHAAGRAPALDPD